MCWGKGDECCEKINNLQNVPGLLASIAPRADDLLKSNGFSVSRSTVPLSRNPIDITFEQTINRHASSHGSFIGFSRHHAAYYRWYLTRQYRVKDVEATLNMVDIRSNETSLHKELKPLQSNISELGITDIKDAFMGFNNLFTIASEHQLFCMS